MPFDSVGRPHARLSRSMLPLLGVYLSAFERMLSKTARRRSGSANNPRKVGSSRLLRACPAPSPVPRLAGVLPRSPRDVNGLEIEPELAGLDAGQVQELVNGLGQLLDADQRGGDQLALPLGKHV